MKYNLGSPNLKRYGNDGKKNKKLFANKVSQGSAIFVSECKSKILNI